MERHGPPGGGPGKPTRPPLAPPAAAEPIIIGGEEGNARPDGGGSGWRSRLAFTAARAGTSGHVASRRPAVASRRPTVVSRPRCPGDGLRGRTARAPHAAAHGCSSKSAEGRG